MQRRGWLVVIVPRTFSTRSATSRRRSEDESFGAIDSTKLKSLHPPLSATTPLCHLPLVVSHLSIASRRLPSSSYGSVSAGPTIGSRHQLNYDLEGTLTVINEEFYTADREARSMDPLLNDFNYIALPPPVPRALSVPQLLRSPSPNVRGTMLRLNSWRLLTAVRSARC